MSFFNELAGVVGKVYARNLFWRDWGECFFSASGSEAGISLIRFVIFCVKGGGVPEEVSIVISDRTSEFVQRGLTAASILLQLGSLPSFQPDAVWAIEGT